MALPRHPQSTMMSEINVTPLVDVMLVLLIVFMVTAPLLMQAVPVNLPKTATVTPLKEPKTLQLTIDTHGALYLEREAVELDALETELKRRRAAHGELSLRLHADDAVRYGRVAEVMALVQRAGIDKLAFITVPR